MNDETREMLENKDYAVITAYHPLPRQTAFYRVIWYSCITAAAIGLVVAFVSR